MGNRILFIVEGADDEKRFIEQYFSSTGVATEYKVFRYGCNLYNFYDCLMEAQPDGDFSELDVLLALKSMARRLPLKEDINVLDDQYTDIFLAFDLDNHDTVHTMEQRHAILQSMASYFTNSTDLGLLLVSSPMVEAYRDVVVLGNEVPTLNKDIAIEQSVDYKCLVDQRGLKQGYSHFSKDTFLIISSLHHVRIKGLIGKIGNDNDAPISFDPSAFVASLIQNLDEGSIPIAASITLVPALLSSSIAEQVLSVPLDTGMHFKKLSKRSDKK